MTSTPDTAKVAFLTEQGFAAVEHDSHVPFLAHLIGTWRLLRDLGCRPALQDAGLFHSVYGTEYFDPGTGLERASVVELIGEEAEHLAWLWCTMRRDTLDPDSGTAVSRRDETTLRLGTETVTDVIDLWIADTVEQIRRMSPGERAFARGLGALTRHASPAVAAALTAVEDALPRLAVEEPAAPSPWPDKAP